MNEKPLGFLQDSNGDLSSGRLVKIISLIMAIITAGAGVLAVVIQANSNPDLTDYCFRIAGLFLATATGSEIVQKATGR